MPMEDPTVSIIEIKKDIKYIKDSVDDIKKGIKEHEERIRKLETYKESTDAVNKFKMEETELNYKKLRNYYTLFLLLFTGLNIVVDLLLKVI